MGQEIGSSTSVKKSIVLRGAGTGVLRNNQVGAYSSVCVDDAWSHEDGEVRLLHPCTSEKGGWLHNTMGGLSWPIEPRDKDDVSYPKVRLMVTNYTFYLDYVTPAAQEFRSSLRILLLTCFVL